MGPADGAQVAVLLGDSDHAPVGQPGHDTLRQPAHGFVRIGHAGEFFGEFGQEHAAVARCLGQRGELGRVRACSASSRWVWSTTAGTGSARRCGAHLAGIDHTGTSRPGVLGRRERDSGFPDLAAGCEEVGNEGAVDIGDERGQVVSHQRPEWHAHQVREGLIGEQDRPVRLNGGGALAHLLDESAVELVGALQGVDAGAHRRGDHQRVHLAVVDRVERLFGQVQPVFELLVGRHGLAGVSHRGSRCRGRPAPCRGRTDRRRPERPVLAGGGRASAPR